MTDHDREFETITALVADEATRTDDGPAAVGRLQRLCRTATRSLAVSGVGVSVLSDVGAQVTAAASEPRFDRIEELQFTVGEGPCIDAFSSRQPVLSPDLEEDSVLRWPGYGPAARAEGVRAVFAFPMQVGAVRLGAVDVYRDEVGGLAREAVLRALIFADIALRTLLDAQLRDGRESGYTLDETLSERFEVYQAQGLVMIQLGVDASEAMSRLRAHAFANDRRLIDVADDIVTRRLTLEGDRP